MTARHAVHKLRWLTPVGTFTAGICVMILAVPVVIWMFILRFPVATRWSAAKWIITMGAGIMTIGWAWCERERRQLRRRG